MIHVIVNPASSSGKGRKEWEEWKPFFDREKKSYQLHFCSGEQTLEEICQKLTDPTVRRPDDEEQTLIILGGDGTMNAAVNGIRDFAHTKVGFLQTGSGNDLSRDMHLPEDREVLIHTMMQEQVLRQCDIGRVVYHRREKVKDELGNPLPDLQEPQDLSGNEEKRLFNISAGIGFDAACCEMADRSRLKRILNRIHLGKLIYLVSAIRLILLHPMERAEIIFEGDDNSNCTRKSGTSVCYARMLLLVCMNHQYEGGGFRFSPRASAEDGRLDLCVAADLNRLMFFRIVPSAFSGKHVKFRNVHLDRIKKVRIRTAIPMWVHTDGEVRQMSDDITVDLLEEKLRLVL